MQCMLPKEWDRRASTFAGLGKSVMYLELACDCRFDVLQLAQILRNRIAEDQFCIIDLTPVLHMQEPGVYVNMAF